MGIFRFFCWVFFIIALGLSAHAKSSRGASYILDNHFITDSETGGHILTIGSLLLQARNESKNRIIKFSVLASHGGHSPTREVGDSQILSNIDTEGVEGVKVYELYLGRKQNNTEFTLGWRDLSQDFNVTPPALNFVNSSFGTSAEFGAAGFRGPGIYPFVSFGGHFWMQGNSPFYLAGALIDPISPRFHYPKQLRTNVLLNEDNHLGLVEMGLHREGKFQWAFGAWNMEMSEHEDFADFKQSGGYFQSYFRFGTWSPFARYGYSSRVLGALMSNLVYGFQKLHILSKHDEFGIGHTRALLFGSPVAEETTETYYQYFLTRKSSVLLSHQFIVNPAFANADAQVFTLRLIINGLN